MPKYIVTSTQVAVMRALRDAKWTEHAIADALCLSRGTVSHNLSGRKSPVADSLDTELGKAIGNAITRSRQVGRTATANALRRAADELEGI